MIDRNTRDLSMNEQCKLLNLHRSGIYYQPKSESTLDLEMMTQIDSYIFKDHFRLFEE